MTRLSKDDFLNTLLCGVLTGASSELTLLAAELDSIPRKTDEPMSFECARLRRDIRDLELKIVSAVSEMAAGEGEAPRWRRPSYRLTQEEKRAAWRRST